MYTSLPRRQAARILEQSAAIAAAFDKDAHADILESATPPCRAEDSNETATQENTRLQSWISNLNR